MIWLKLYAKQAVCLKIKINLQALTDYDIRLIESVIHGAVGMIR